MIALWLYKHIYIDICIYKAKGTAIRVSIEGKFPVISHENEFPKDFHSCQSSHWNNDGYDNGTEKIERKFCHNFDVLIYIWFVFYVSC